MTPSQLARAMRSLTPHEKIKLAAGLVGEAHTARAPRGVLRTAATLLRAPAGELEVIAEDAPVGE